MFLIPFSHLTHYLYIYIYYIYTHLYILTLSAFCIDIKYILIIQRDIFLKITDISNLTNLQPTYIYKMQLQDSSNDFLKIMFKIHVKSITENYEYELAQRLNEFLFDAQFNHCTVIQMITVVRITTK